MTEEIKVGAWSYTTKGTEKKLLSDAMAASRTKHILKKRRKNTIVMEEDILEDHIVSVEEEKDISWTECKEGSVGLRSVSEVTKSSS